METWIFQGGYPVIDVDETRIEQRRFTYSGDGTAATWTVPVQIRTTSGDVSIIELAESSADLPVSSADIDSFNHLGHGFYRVKLPSEHLTRIGTSGVEHLEPVERFGLIDDTWTLTLAGETNLRDFIALLDGYRHENDISVWQRIIGALGFIDHVATDADRQTLGIRVADLIEHTRAQLGSSPIEGESARDAQLRGSLLGAAGTLTANNSDIHIEAIEAARRLLAQDSPDAELRSAAVKIVAANGNDDDFSHFRRAFEAADNPQAEIRFLYALPAFPEAHHLDELVTMTLDGSIRTQNAPFVLAQALMNRVHGPAVWARVRSSWDEINALFPANTIVRMLTGVRWLTDPQASSDVSEFFAGRSLPQGQKQLDQHLERLAVNARFRASVVSSLASALS